MSVSPFVSVGKPTESNKNEKEYSGSEIKKKSHIKFSRQIKVREQLRKKVTKLGYTKFLYLNITHQAYMLLKTVT